MDQLSEAEMRALDARCRLPTSPASRTAVVRLRALPPDSQTLCIANYAGFDLPHLVRCALEAVRHSHRELSVGLTQTSLSACRASQLTRAGASNTLTRQCCASLPSAAANER
jgi:hypothetical protein